MKRPMPEIQNYASEVLPLLRLWNAYNQGFLQMLRQVPGTFYAGANFNLKGVQPEWCRQRLNLFDMKLARCLLGKNWSKRSDANGHDGLRCQSGRHTCTTT